MKSATIRRLAGAVTVLVCSVGTCVLATAAMPEAVQQKERWVQDRLLDDKRLPFAFQYDGRPAAELLGSWTKRTETQKLDAARTRHTRTWTDVKTGLEVRCVAVAYADFPAVEWTVYFKNAGQKNTPLLGNLQGLDAPFERGQEGEFVLHHWNGDTSRSDLYRPLELRLGPGVKRRFAPKAAGAATSSFPTVTSRRPAAE